MENAKVDVVMKEYFRSRGRCSSSRCTRTSHLRQTPEGQCKQPWRVRAGNSSSGSQQGKAV